MPKSVLTPEEQAFIERTISEVPKDLPGVLGKVTEVLAAHAQLGMKGSDPIIHEITNMRMLGVVCGAFGEILEAVARFSKGNPHRRSLLLTQVVYHLTVLAESELFAEK